MQTLSYETLAKTGYDGYLLPNAPERILQFGEGNFLRAFVDSFVDIANEKCGFNSKVVLAQPIAQGLAGMVNAQQGLYTLYLRGMENGKAVEEKRVVSCVSRCIDPYEDFGALLAVARSRDLRFVVSNTTEAGIAFDPACRFDDAPPASYPAKLTRCLFERYTALGGQAGSGLVVLPCELIDDNGGALKRCVQQYAALWHLEAGFAAWLEAEVLFCSTLVDRIVTGYPRAEADALNAASGYEDKLMVTAEPFGLWVIEGPDWLRETLPFEKAGLPVVVTSDHKPYKQRKVRILNGAHTTLFAAAYLAGMDIVRQCMENDEIVAFLRRAVYDEIIPTLTLPKAELEAFANAVWERFQNPFIDHSLLAISLNSVSKWRARVLPSVRGYAEKTGSPPTCLTFGFAALLQFYSGSHRDGKPYEVADDRLVLDFFAAHSADEPAALVQSVCANTNFWGEDLNGIPGFAQMAAAQLAAIRQKGMAAGLAQAAEG